MPYPRLVLELPPWIDDVVAEVLGDPVRPVPDVAGRMRLAVALSARNVAAGGGPFGAAVFDCEEHRLVAPAVNLVLPAGTSIAHAEIVALAIAQRVVGRFELAGDPARSYELVTSTEPCAQCFGAVPWSGVRRLVCGARTEDAEAIGFDEGPKPADWVAALAARDVAVERDVLRDEARAVLERYAADGGLIYNATGPAGGAKAP